MANKIMKAGRVCVVLTGKYAGAKVIVLKLFTEPTRDRNHSHVLVCGMSNVPRKVTKDMSEKKIEKRVKVKTFVKYYNVNHLFPTRIRYEDDEVNYKAVLKSFDEMTKVKKDEKDAKRDPLNNEDCKRELKTKFKNVLEEKYKKLDLNSTDDKTTKVKFLFKKLRF